MVRLREEHWGALEDAQAVRLARQGGGDLAARICARARFIARREGLEARLQTWRRGAALVLGVLLLVAVITGAVAAMGALGDGSRPVNVLWAVGALLGLHLFTFVLWLGSFALPAGIAGGGLAGVWLWGARKFARGPDAALPAGALLAMLARARGLRWLFGVVSHGLWLVALSACLGTLVAVLSTARYEFVWATTLLTPEAFVRLTAWLGWLPALLGFAMPDADTVRASGGVVPLPGAAQAQWSLWLIGALVTYGIVPRALAALLSAVLLLRARRRMGVDTRLAGWTALAPRLQPPSDDRTIDAAAGPLHQAQVGRTAAGQGPRQDQPIVAGIELPAEIPWPPPDLPADVWSAGNLDNRADRNALLDRLAAAPARRLLLVCDGGQTPDRGTLALIAALSAHSEDTAVWLLPAATPRIDRRDAWLSQLQAAGMAAPAIMAETGAAFQWLTRPTQGNPHG